MSDRIIFDPSQPPKASFASGGKSLGFVPRVECILSSAREGASTFRPKGSTNKGMALMTILVLIFILTILAGVMLTLMSSQVRLIEHDNSRTASRYAEEAVMVRELELLRKNLTVDSSYSINNMTININYAPGAGLNQTDKLNLSHDYSVIF